MTVACVLRSGGDFGPKDVHALAAGIDEHMSGAKMRVYADVPLKSPLFWWVRLEHEWPGWWAKMEALDPARWEPGSRVVLMDLDTLPVSDLGALAAYDGGFAMLRALDPKRAARGRLVSGVMAYRAGPGTESARLYDLFASDPERWMQEYRGDGEFLEAHQRGADGLQDHVPGIYSLKWQAQSRMPPDATLVLGHGQPRLSDRRAGWAHRLWAERAA